MGEPVTLDMSTAKPLQASAVTLDMSTAQPLYAAQPSTWGVITQPMDKTDKEYLSYRGPAGVAGATIKGLDDVGHATLGAFSGMWNTVRHPIDTAKSIAELPTQAAQVPAAVSDINESSDPTGHYLNVAQDTASQGAGQALSGLIAHGMGKMVPGAVRLGARSAEAAINQKLVPVRPILNLGTPADEAEAVHLKVPGRDFGLQKPDTPNSAFDPAASRARTMPGQVAPEIIQPEPPSPPVRRGPLLLEAQTPSTIDQAVNSPSRTMSGQIAAEMTRPPASALATPIPPRSGLALPPAPAGSELADLWTPRAMPAAQSGEALGVVRQPGQAGQIAASMQKPVPAEVAPGFQRGALQGLLEKALDAKPLDPKLPLKQQMSVTAPAASGSASLAETEHLGQFARANGLELHQAIPETVEGDVLRAKIHDLTNVQVRQLAINAGVDMGQLAVTNAKNAGGVTRQQALQWIMMNHSPEEIGRLIDKGGHLPAGGEVRGRIAAAMAKNNGR